MVSVSRQAICASLIVLAASWSVSAADLDRYREFRLGSTAAAVLKLVRMSERDVKTLHERPARLQELEWRPWSLTPGRSADAESVRNVVFSFVDDQLFKMVVEYERSRTKGLTTDDMIASLSAIYGARSPLPPQPARRPGYDPLDAPTIIAHWRSSGTTVALRHSDYSGTFGLVITSVPLEVLARKAQATAVTLDAREAPAREAARLEEEAAAARDAAEKTRTTNRDGFKP